LFQHKGDISNIYTYKIINKTNNDFNDVHFKLAGIKGSLKLVEINQSAKQGMKNGTLFVEIISFYYWKVIRRRLKLGFMREVSGD
jgi:hypothetical protein